MIYVECESEGAARTEQPKLKSPFGLNVKFSASQPFAKQPFSNEKACHTKLVAKIKRRAEIERTRIKAL